jgi:hypothetical protein
MASKEEATFPPRCCKKEIPRNEFLPMLDQGTRTSFEESAREFDTNPKDRIYCSNTACSKFLANAAAIGQKLRLFLGPEVLPCDQCQHRTCSRCREADHPGRRFCERQEETHEVQELLRANNWQRCPNCHRVVELTQGCFHITCVCKQEFCYRCAAAWKTCTCPQWEERLLFAEATRQVDAQIRYEDRDNRVVGGNYGFGSMRRELDQVARQTRIEQAVRRLREDHECNHSWVKRNGGGTCDHCGHYLALYLLVCSPMFTVD